MVSASNARKTTGQARSKDGTRLAYSLHTRDGARPRIALVHSLALDQAFWNPVVERLLPHADILTIDCRGHGASDKPAGPYSAELFADDLAAVMDHIGWHSAMIAGASMGGCVAIAFGARHGDRITALGLIDTTAWYGPDAPKNWGDRAVRAQEAGLADMVGFQKTRWFGDAFREQHPEVVDASLATFLKNDVAAFGASCNLLGSCDLRSVLPKLRVPAAVIVGEDDAATPPAMAQALHQGIAGSSLTVIKGGRHLTPLETPDAVAGALLHVMPTGVR